MSDEIHIVTNWHRRPIIDAYELTEKERREFDYLDWPAIDRGEDSATFFRYRGTLYDLGDIESVSAARFPNDHPFQKWDGYISDSFFSGILFRWEPDNYEYDYVIIGRYWT